MPSTIEAARSDIARRSEAEEIPQAVHRTAREVVIPSGNGLAGDLGGGATDDPAHGRSFRGPSGGGREETPWIEVEDSLPEVSGVGRKGEQEKAAGGGERFAGRRRMADLLGERLGRLNPGQPGARALAVVGLVAALIAGGYLWQSRPRPQPVADVIAPTPMTPVASSTALAGPTPAGVTVHVAGKVRRPGVVTLPAGARVADAIRAAGGLRPGAGTGSLNLARRVVDGEQIAVGVPAAPQPGAAPPGTSGVPAPGQPLDLNTATVEQFDALPGVGPVLAQRIVEYRTRNGGFRSVEQLQEVTGIGERRYAELKDLVRV
ncbi:helix-hairpin-helix domain-containing protein [Thermomonospora cellulosilytica]|uniref:Competence protein ComEA n=1 Tax=Thermomonospora cellulosilytica TaxID=1411118 RepID=A0A7W3N3M9_9ACTN|nr:helix-hairpin-helix domain-containing protein [Thermomonospora cellulosilytica]MBA9006920.1 competence protein ComEA [Thermomonospora cellulosilytica]